MLGNDSIVRSFAYKVYWFKTQQHALYPLTYQELGLGEAFVLKQ